jgi:Flp pilus assembly pilin Flp
MLINLYAYLQSRFSREEGQTMAEYGVVLAVITLTAVAAFLLLGQRIDDAVDRVIGFFPGGS